MQAPGKWFLIAAGIIYIAFGLFNIVGSMLISEMFSPILLLHAVYMLTIGIIGIVLSRSVYKTSLLIALAAIELVWTVPYKSIFGQLVNRFNCLARAHSIHYRRAKKQAVLISGLIIRFCGAPVGATAHGRLCSHDVVSRRPRAVAPTNKVASHTVLVLSQFLIGGHSHETWRTNSSPFQPAGGKGI